MLDPSRNGSYQTKEEHGGLTLLAKAKKRGGSKTAKQAMTIGPSASFLNSLNDPEDTKLQIKPQTGLFDIFNPSRSTKITLTE